MKTKEYIIKKFWYREDTNEKILLPEGVKVFRDDICDEVLQDGAYNYSFILYKTDTDKEYIDYISEHCAVTLIDFDTYYFIYIHNCLFINEEPEYLEGDSLELPKTQVLNWNDRTFEFGGVIELKRYIGGGNAEGIWFTRFNDVLIYNFGVERRKMKMSNYNSWYGINKLNGKCIDEYKKAIYECIETGKTNVDFNAYKKLADKFDIDSDLEFRKKMEDIVKGNLIMYNDETTI